MLINTDSWTVILWLIRCPCTAGWILVESLANAYIITVGDIQTQFSLKQNFTST